MALKSINNRFDALIESVVGIPVADLKQQAPKQTSRLIEKKLGKPMKLAKPDSRIEFRGSPLLAAGRVTLTDIDAEFNAKFGVDG